MGKKFLILSGLIAIGAYFAYKCHGSCSVPALPELNPNEWWGPGEPKELSDKVLPFMIEAPREIIVDLQDRLNKFLIKSPTPPLENQGFQYGFNTDYLKEVIKYWKDDYLNNWTTHQKYLNVYPHFKTYVNGLHMHFVRVRPKNAEGKKVLPLLLLHGWPGSVREFYDIFPLLAIPKENSDFVFDIIAPSLPGYGFSQGSSKTGLGTAQIAVIMKNLMKRIGYDKFYVQGGDWGAAIARNLATLYPDNVLGMHSNFCAVSSLKANLRWLLGSLWPSFIVEEKFQHKMYPVSKIFFNLLEETGYAHIQATKPDTIGTALQDTPAGLAAYILEKFSTWTNPSFKTLPDGGLTKKFTLDALLDNVMVYYISRSITTSQRLYSENFNSVNGVLDKIPTTVPTACARFAHELLWQPESTLKLKFPNLLQISDFDDGGHFAAFEKPKELSDDIWAAVKKFEEFNDNLKRSHKN